jgi:uncharacterized lipoprotein YmbA
VSRGRIPIATLAFVCLSAACSILAPHPDLSRFFVLRPVAGAKQATEGARRITLGLGPVVLPGYLTRPQIVRRSGQNELRVSQTEVWAEPLERNFARVVAEDLGEFVGTVTIVQIPSFTPIEIDYQIPIQVLRFEADEHGTVFLEARWAIRRPREKQLVHSAESSFSETAADSSTEAVVAAMGQAAAKLSGAIAAEIHGLAAGEDPR